MPITPNKMYGYITKQNMGVMAIMEKGKLVGKIVYVKRGENTTSCILKMELKDRGDIVYDDCLVGAGEANGCGFNRLNEALTYAWKQAIQLWDDEYINTPLPAKFYKFDPKIFQKEGPSALEAIGYTVRELA